MNKRKEAPAIQGARERYRAGVLKYKQMGYWRSPNMCPRTPMSSRSSA